MPLTDKVNELPLVCMVKPADHSERDRGSPIAGLDGWDSSGKFAVRRDIGARKSAKMMLVDNDNDGENNDVATVRHCVHHGIEQSEHSVHLRQLPILTFGNLLGASLPSEGFTFCLGIKSWPLWRMLVAFRNEHLQ